MIDSICFTILNILKKNRTPNRLKASYKPNLKIEPQIEEVNEKKRTNKQTTHKKNMNDIFIERARGNYRDVCFYHYLSSFQ